MSSTHDTTRIDLAEALLAASSNGLLVLADHEVLGVNDRLCELLGTSREALLRAGLDAPQWPTAALEAVAVARGTRRRVRRAVDLQRNGNGTAPASVTATRVDAGHAGSLLVVEVHDGSERERPFEAIYPLDGRLRRLAEGSPAAFWTLDLDGLCTYATPRWTEITGQRVEDSLGRGWQQAVHPADRDRVARAWAAWRSDPTEPRSAEYRVLHPDGSVRTVVEVNRLVRDPDGEPIGYSGATIDVTDVRHDKGRLCTLAERQAALAALGRRALERGTSLDDLLRMAVATAGAQLDGDFATIGRVSCDGTQYGLVAIYRRDAVDSPAGQQIPLGRDSQVGLALAEDTPVVTEDTELETRYDVAGGLAYGVRASVTVPIQSGDRMLGGIGVHFLEPRAIPDDDVDFLVSVANVVAGLDERLRYEEGQHRAALVDPLTGLANRLVIRELLGRELAARAPGGPRPAVLLVDVDHLAHVNDAYGSAVGDALLVAIARRLEAVAGPDPVVARLASDEFALVCSDSGSSAALLAERVLEAFSEPFEIEAGALQVTASIGVATSLGVDDIGADALVRGAEAARANAKAAGRARLAWYDPELAERARSQVETAVALRHAVDRDEMVLLYQPVIDLNSGAVDGFEALVRWQRPGVERLVTPDRFIPVAEHTGAIVDIGRWVVWEACRRLGEWNGVRGDRALRVSVNVAAREVAQPDWAAGVLAAVEANGIDPCQLGVELTESALVEESDAAIVALATVRAAGVRLLIDDFGTGYASLAYLKRFQPDELKLDRSFVFGLGEAQADTTIVAAIVGMAHALGLRVTAEGVERPGQVASLQALGCERAQGFLFARPMTADAVLPGRTD